MDRYLVGKWKARECLSRELLPLTALATILISSKYEDVIAISASHLVEKAGHGKFTIHQLFEKELDILQTLSFLINEGPSVYHEASLLYSNFQDQASLTCPELNSSIFEEGLKYIDFLSYISSFNLGICQLDKRLVAHALLDLTFSDSLIGNLKLESPSTSSSSSTHAISSLSSVMLLQRGALPQNGKNIVIVNEEAIL